MDIDLDTPVFQISIAAHASGWTTEQLRQILARAAREAKLLNDLGETEPGLMNLGIGAGEFQSKSLITASKPGRATLYSLRSIYRFAIASRLVTSGIPIGQATLAALKFTDFGDEARPPGQLFGDPKLTALCCFANHARVISVDRGDRVFGWPHMQIGAPGDSAVTTIWLNPLIKSVDERLDAALKGAGE